MAGERGNTALGILQALPGLASMFIGSGTTTGGGTTKTSSLDPTTIAALQAMVNPTGQYSKDAAKTDSTGAVQQAMKMLMQGPNGLADIGHASNAGGGYNASTTDLLKNDLASRVAGVGAEIQQKQIGEYAGIQNQAAATLKNANTTTVTNESKQTGAQIDPLSALAVIGGGLLFKHVLNGGFNGSSTDTSSGGSTGIDFLNKKSKSDIPGMSGDFSSFLSAITPEFSSNSASSPMTPSSNPTSGATGGFLDSISGGLSDIGTGLGIQQLGGYISSLFGPSTPGANTGTTVSADGSSITGGSNDIGDFFKGIFSSIFG